MPTATLLTLRAEDRLIRALDLIVSTTGQSHQHHLNRALVQYVKRELEHIQAIAEGIIDSEVINLASHETNQANATPQNEQNR